MSDIKDQLIKLGEKNPGLRDDIRPVLDRLAGREKSAGFEDNVVTLEGSFIEEALQEVGLDIVNVEIFLMRKGPAIDIVVEGPPNFSIKQVERAFSRWNVNVDNWNGANAKISLSK